MASSSLLINLALLSKRPTGISTYVNNLLPHLRPASPTVLLPQHAASDFGLSPCLPIPDNLSSDHGSPGHLRRLWWTQTQLPQYYRQTQASLLFTPLPEAPLYQGCRYIVVVYDLIPLRFPDRRSPLTVYWRYYVPTVLKQAAHIICISDATAQDLNQFLGVTAERMTAIPLAYDASHFRFLNLPTHPYFLYVGRHNPHKNLHRMITAFAELVSSWATADEYQLWLAGPSDDRYTPTLKQLVTDLRLQGRVKFLDYLPYAELPQVINQATALLFPTLWEGFGLPVLEAMACGTPVITSNVSSLPEVAGEAALLVNPYQVSEIATAMRSLIKDAQLRTDLRRIGLQRAQVFNWAQTATLTLDVLNQFN